MVKTLQPTCLINSRIGHNRGDYAQTGDNAIPIQVYLEGRQVGSACDAERHLGLQEERPELEGSARPGRRNWPTSPARAATTCSTSGRPPKASSRRRARRSCASIGKWLTVNGESIYGTGPSPFHFPDITWRATVKPGKVYLHILNWPGTKLRAEGTGEPGEEGVLPGQQGRGASSRRRAQCSNLTLPAAAGGPVGHRGGARDRRPGSRRWPTATAPTRCRNGSTCTPGWHDCAARRSATTGRPAAPASFKRFERESNSLCLVPLQEPRRRLRRRNHLRLRRRHRRQQVPPRLRAPRRSCRGSHRGCN